MAVEYVIDGYNVIHKHPETAAHMNTGPRGPEEARRKLLHLLAVRFAQKKVNMRVVFDGKYPGLSTQSPFPKINAVYSFAPETADEVIINYVENAARPRSITVVTSDREIRRQVEDTGCGIMTSEVFVGRFLRTGETEEADSTEEIRHRKLTDEQVKEWISYFGMDEEEEQ